MGGLPCSILTINHKKMKLINKAIVAVFPKIDAGTLAPNTQLGLLPGWDSMNAINLQIELEALTGRPDLELVLTPDMTLTDLASALKKRGVTLD